MNNLKTSFQCFIFLILIYLPGQGYCQKQIALYLGDTSFYRTYDGESLFYFDFKPVLPDGNYLLYDVRKDDSLSRFKSVILKGQFQNGKREGEFLTNAYTYKKKKRILQFQKQWFYLNGQKNGLEDYYFYDECDHRYLTQHGEYYMGRKNGFFMEMDRKFNLGSASTYHDDTLISYTDYFSFANLRRHSHIDFLDKNNFSITLYNYDSDISQVVFYAKNNQFVRYKIFDQWNKVLEDKQISMSFAAKDIFSLLRSIKVVRVNNLLDPKLREETIDKLTKSLSYN